MDSLDFLSNLRVTDFNLDECYRHPNGFIKLTLNAAHQNERLHVWNYKCENEAESTPHDHPWDFESTLLLGRLRCIYFSEEPGNEFKKYACVASKEPGYGHKLKLSSEVRLNPILDIVLARGSSYFQRSSMIHNVFPASTGLIVSKVRIRSTKGLESSVFSREQIPGTVKNVQLSKSFLSEMIEELSE